MNTRKKFVLETDRGEKSSHDFFLRLGEASGVLDKCHGGVVEDKRCTPKDEGNFLKKKSI